MNCDTHQQRHHKLVQVDHLDAAHIQLHFAVGSGGVSVSGALGGVGSQTHVEAEHLITHDGDSLRTEASERSKQRGGQ